MKDKVQHLKASSCLLRATLILIKSILQILDQLAVSGTQAQVAAIVPSSGPDIGRVSEIAINNGGTNYRVTPSIIFDDPYYGQVATVGTITQTTTGSLTASTSFTGVAQKSVVYWYRRVYCCTTAMEMYQQ